MPCPVVLNRDTDPEAAARAALAVLGRKISGEANELRRLMPEDVRAIWPDGTR